MSSTYGHNLGWVFTETAPKGMAWMKPLTLDPTNLRAGVNKPYPQATLDVGGNVPVGGTNLKIGSSNLVDT
jgi:hypothetical protein